jgi:drug/metabolite transporter (DMT)-like permease
VLVPLIGWVLYKKKPGAQVFAAALLALAGIALLSLQGDLSVNTGDVLTLVCGFFYAVHIVFIEKYTAAEDPILLTVLQLAWAAVFSWILSPLYDGAFPAYLLASKTAVTSMLYLGLVCTMITFFLQNLCQKYTASSTAALLLSLESVFGAIASAVFLSERMSARMIAGCIILFGAIVLAQTKPGFITFRRSGLQSEKETVKRV